MGLWEGKGMGGGGKTSGGGLKGLVGLLVPHRSKGGVGLLMS